MRFENWLNSCNNPRIKEMDAMIVHKRYRICRRHFDAECLNGGCRRLLNTAVPTLYLDCSTGNTSPKEETQTTQLINNQCIDDPLEEISYIMSDENELDDDSNEHFKLVVSNKTVVLPTLCKF